MKTVFLCAALLPVLGCVPLRAQESTAPAAAVLGQGDWAFPEKKENFHIFLLMGQSNMAGHGGIAAGDPYLPGDKDPVPQILVLDGQCDTNDNDIKPVEPIAWRPGAHRLHLRMDSEQFGLGMDFAKQYLKDHPGVTVGLIPCAWGGEPIDRLSKGTPIYRNAMERAKVAKEKGVIKGVLWHQGESDSVSKALADAYEGKLKKLIGDLRADLGDAHLPVVVGNLAEFYGVNHGHGARITLINEVRAALYRIGTELPDTGFAPTTGLEADDGNFVHFNRASYIVLGQRYAKAMLEVQKNPKRGHD